MCPILVSSMLLRAKHPWEEFASLTYHQCTVSLCIDDTNEFLPSSTLSTKAATAQPHSQAPMLRYANIEVVQMWRAWYFGGREILIVCGHTQDLEQEKEQRQRATCYMYLVIGGRISYTPSVEWIAGCTMCKMLPFCFSPILITSCLHRKDTRFSPHIRICVLELGNEASYSYYGFYATDVLILDIQCTQL